MHCLTQLVTLGLISSAFAHMELMYPAPFRSKFNPNKPPNPDFSMSAPLSGAAQFPCKGYHKDLGTPAGASVASWSTGSTQNFTVTGGAAHDGGSCQAALSYDKGASFKVIHSYIGSCPLSDGQKFDFNIPSDAPLAKNVIFAWTWHNKIGNREIYQNCAAIDITAGSSSGPAPKVAFATRPGLFVANLDNGCKTVETKDVVFPNPGPDVTVSKKTGDNSGSFTGNCKAVNGVAVQAGAAPVGASAQSSAGSVPQASSASSTGTLSSILSIATSVLVFTIIPSSFATVASSATSSKQPSNAPGIFATVAPTAASPAAPSLGPTGVPSGTPNGLGVTEDGQCSGRNTCNGSIHGPCCSEWGWCGSTIGHCGTGCQPGFGQCGSFSNTTANAKTTRSISLKKRGPRRFSA